MTVLLSGKQGIAVRWTRKGTVLKAKEKRVSVETASSDSSDFENSSSDRRRAPERRENKNNNSIPGLQNSTKSPTDLAKPNLDVSVDQNIERAMRVLKRKLIREGLFKELKLRRYFEKPCEKRKRKKKEALKRVRKEEHRQRRNMNGLF